MIRRDGRRSDKVRVIRVGVGSTPRRMFRNCGYWSGCCVVMPANTVSAGRTGRKRAESAVIRCWRFAICMITCSGCGIFVADRDESTRLRVRFQLCAPGMAHSAKSGAIPVHVVVTTWR